MRVTLARNAFRIDSAARRGFGVNADTEFPPSAKHSAQTPSTVPGSVSPEQVLHTTPADLSSSSNAGEIFWPYSIVMWAESDFIGVVPTNDGQ